MTNKWREALRKRRGAPLECAQRSEWGLCFHLAHVCPYIVMALLSERGGAAGWKELGGARRPRTEPTVSTCAGVVAGQPWTLINLSSPAALNIQFKGPATDSNNLPFSSDRNSPLVQNWPSGLVCLHICCWSCFHFSSIFEVWHSAPLLEISLVQTLSQIWFLAHPDWNVMAVLEA